MKKTKHREERYKNTNKMSDVRIMKKIIIQIYNNLQVLWSSKVKFVSLSQLLGFLSLGLTLVFSEFQVLLSHLWGFLKKRERRKKRYKGRERRSRTRKKEREEEGV